MNRPAKERILEALRPYPEYSTIPQLSKDLKINYTVVQINLLELVIEKKVGLVKFTNTKFFFAPYREDIDRKGHKTSPIMNIGGKRSNVSSESA